MKIRLEVKEKFESEEEMMFILPLEQNIKALRVSCRL